LLSISRLEREAVEEVVTDLFGVRMSSTFGAVKNDKGRIGFKIEGPEIKALENENAPE
jgi:hypothetical protein